MNKPTHKLLGALPYVFCSIGILASNALYADSVPLSLEEKVIVKEVPAPCPTTPKKTNAQTNTTQSVGPCVASGPLQYVGGKARVGIGIDSELTTRTDLSYVFSETDDSATSAEAWVGVNPRAKSNSTEPTLTGAGAKLNHHWVSKDEKGQVSHVNKAFVAVDQNGKRRRKVTAGYGQENKDLFWEAYGSKGFGKEFWVGTDANYNEIVEKAYDYGVGARVGKTFDDQLVRVRAGLDYEWASDYAKTEDRPTQITATIGAEKFFQDSPHSVSVNASYYKKAGGAGSLKQSGTRGNINYRYDIGKNIFRTDQKFRRVRVEIPGTPRPPKYKRELVKNTMELEADSFFQLDKHELTPKAKKRLESVIARIRQSGHEGNIRITGNTCNLGSLKHNQKLSERRAEAVRQFFISKGFKPNELIARGLGETHPKYPNTKEEGHKNRRVDIEYVTVQKKFRKVLVDPGGPGEPKITWRQERCPTPPIWVQRALHNQIQYKTTVDDYRTTIIADNNDVGGGDNGGSGNGGGDNGGSGNGGGNNGGGNNGGGNNGGNTQQPPVGVDDFLTTWVNEPGGLKISTALLLQNDYDPNGDALQFAGIITPPSHGSIVDLGNGYLKYTPRHNFCGKDTFTYTVSDGKGGTATATVHIDVQATH